MAGRLQGCRPTEVRGRSQIAQLCEKMEQEGQDRRLIQLNELKKCG